MMATGLELDWKLQATEVKVMIVDWGVKTERTLWVS